MGNLSCFGPKSGGSSYNALSSKEAPSAAASSVSKAGPMPMGQSSMCNLESISEEQMKKYEEFAKGDWFATQYRPGVCIKKSSTEDLKSI